MPDDPQPVRKYHLTFLDDHPRTRAVLLVAVTIVAVGMAGQILSQSASLVRPVLIPTAIAVLLTGLLMPLQVVFNHRLRIPRSLSALLTLLIAVGAVTALMWVAGAQLASGVRQLLEVATLELSQIHTWIEDSPLPISGEQASQVMDEIEIWLNENQGRLAQEATDIGASAASILVGTILCLVGTFFFLSQGDRIATWFIRLLPRSWRERTFQASRRGWVSIGTYTKTQVIVAFVDAVGIGIGAAILGLPFVLPLIAITFILCFIPIIGAVLSGAIAVLIAMTFEGFTAAIIMLIIVLAVQQLESNILSPVLMGKAVNVHPIGVLLGVATGTYLFGLVGALFAVPLLATINSMTSYLSGNDPFPGLTQGRSALTDSAKRLVGDQGKMRIPGRIGQATPDWVEGQTELLARKARRRHRNPGNDL